MTTKVFFTITLSLCFIVSCDLLDSNKSGRDELGWDKTSIPSELKGEWNLNGFQYMKITSSKVIVENREWGITSFHKKDNEYRFMLKSELQYRALYFRNIVDSTAEKSFGAIMYTLYDAKIAGREEWVIVGKT